MDPAKPRTPVIPPLKWNQALSTYERPGILQGGLSIRKGLGPVEFGNMGFMGELQRGTKIEYEHTNDFFVALSIACDHMAENPYYYQYLERMEDQMEKDHHEKVIPFFSVQ